MLKKIGLPAVALVAGLFLANPTPAKAGVQFGVQIGPSYPAYSYGYVDPYPGYYATPYPNYYYSSPYPSYYYSTPAYRNRGWGFGDRYRGSRSNDYRRYREHDLRDRRGYRR